MPVLVSEAASEAMKLELIRRAKALTLNQQTKTLFIKHALGRAYVNLHKWGE